MDKLFTFDTIQAGLIILLLLVLGDFLARKCGGRVPAMLFAGLLFMLISWTGIFPPNMAEAAGISGLASAAAGFLDRETIKRSGCEVFFFFALMGTVMSGYTRATPQMFAYMLVPLLLVLALESAVVLFVSPLLGKLLGFGRDMSVCLGSNIMMGFPLNMMIANGIAETLTDDEEEREYLENQIATRMVIAGLSTTTSVAVLMGGLLVELMH